jgi:hypothetical protein
MPESGAGNCCASAVVLLVSLCVALAVVFVSSDIDVSREIDSFSGMNVTERIGHALCYKYAARELEAHMRAQNTVDAIRHNELLTRLAELSKQTMEQHEKQINVTLEAAQKGNETATNLHNRLAKQFEDLKQVWPRFMTYFGLLVIFLISEGHCLTLFATWTTSFMLMASNAHAVVVVTMTFVVFCATRAFFHPLNVGAIRVRALKLASGVRVGIVHAVKWCISRTCKRPATTTTAAVSVTTPPAAGVPLMIAAPATGGRMAPVGGPEADEAARPTTTRTVKFAAASQPAVLLGAHATFDNDDDHGDDQDDGDDGAGDDDEFDFYIPPVPLARHHRARGPSPPGGAGPRVFDL